MIIQGKIIMKKILTYSFCLLFTCSSQAFDSSQLIKVTPDITQKCVEYFSYQGEAYCSTTALTNQSVEPNLQATDRQNIVFDERPWQAVWGKDTPAITTIEYVPAGDDINNWSELLTSQYIPQLDKKLSAKDYYNLYAAKLKETKLNAVIKVHKESPDEIIFEFRITSPANMEQDELEKIVTTDKEIYILYYIVKKGDMGSEDRDKWLKNLEDSSVKP